ncbi:MAG: NADH-quinone oxidoreductase subunit C [Acidilobaceae archaeon]
MVVSLSERARIVEEALKRAGLRVARHVGVLEVEVDKSRIVEAALALRELGFDHVKAVVAVDEPENERIRVSYVVSSFDESETLVALTVDVSRSDPRLESLTRVWPSTELQEREVYELFGVVFENHPDLRPVLLDPELAEKKVMRRDFRIEW